MPSYIWKYWSYNAKIWNNYVKQWIFCGFLKNWPDWCVPIELKQVLKLVEIGQLLLRDRNGSSKNLESHPSLTLSILHHSPSFSLLLTYSLISRERVFWESTAQQWPSRTLRIPSSTTASNKAGWNPSCRQSGVVKRWQLLEVDPPALLLQLSWIRSVRDDSYVK